MLKSKLDEKQYDFYIAGPFFNVEQLIRVENVKFILDQRGLTYFSPKDNITLKSDASTEERAKAFDDNLDAIRDSRFVLAITDDKDVGTMFESGYAYANNIPIIYFAETLGDNKFNVMLAESCVDVLRSMDDLRELNLDLMNQFCYNGAVE